MSEATIRTGEIVEVYPTAIWIESDLFGGQHVMVQHQAPGREPFCYASFYYDYAYTSNSSIRAAAERLARQLGASDPVEYRARSFPKRPSADELRAQIAALKSLLDATEGA